MTPRNKNRPLLWELSRSASRTAPNRLRPNRPTRMDAARTDSTKPESLPPVNAEGSPSDADSPGVPHFESEIMPMVETDPYGLHLHLRWSATAVIGAALVVLLIAAFAAGRIVGGVSKHSSGGADTGTKTAIDEKSAPDKPATPKLSDVPRGRENSRGVPSPDSGKSAPAAVERHEPPAPAANPEPQPAKATQTAPAEADDEPAGTFKLQPGFSYIVVQHFPKSKRADADKAAAFLHDKGMPTVILPGADLRLVVNDPFDTKSTDTKQSAMERERLRQWVEFVKKQGVEYQKIGGYNFSKAEVLEEK